MKTESRDNVMQALLHPFIRGGVSARPNGRILLVNAAPTDIGILNGTMQAWQWWKSLADDLQSTGIKTTPTPPEDGETYDIALVRLPHQRAEGQYTIAVALRHLKPDGLLVVAAANDSGGGRLVKDLQPFFPNLQSDSKHKCKIVWMSKCESTDLPQSWLEAGGMQRVDDFWTQPGLFSWDRIDPATTMLLSALPGGFNGTMADLGCGLGVITDHILKTSPALSQAHCIDADARAIVACRKTMEACHAGRKIDYHWFDLAKPLALPLVDIVVTNPPFHIEKSAAASLGQAFIKNAHAILKPKGTLFMVANAHLPYEQTLGGIFKTVEKIKEDRGFKIYKAEK